MDQQRDRPGRFLVPDLVRAFALFGIAVVNVTGFAQPLTTGFHTGGLERPVDQFAYGAVATLFLMKSYPLFSMMFGAGLYYQQAAAERASVDLKPRYFRRMTALVVLGGLHFIFFWIGVILITYGLLGALLFTLRTASVSFLVRAGAALIALNTVLLFSLAGLLWMAERSAPGQLAGYERMTTDALRAFGEGSFGDAARYRFDLLPAILASLIGQQGLSVFGFFCLGLAAAKSGAIARPDAPIWRRCRRVFLPVGLAGSLVGAFVLLQAHSSVDSTYLFGCAVMMGFSAFGALGYMGLIAAWAHAAGPMRRYAARAGSASLTAYLLQSLILSVIFTGYGLGAYGHLSASEAIAVAAAVALLSLAFAAVWRGFAARGPMEVLLRRITYWGRA
jgi:uncharacterized protein